MDPLCVRNEVEYTTDVAADDVERLFATTAEEVDVACDDDMGDVEEEEEDVVVVEVVEEVGDDDDGNVDADDDTGLDEETDDPDALLVSAIL